MAVWSLVKFIVIFFLVFGKRAQRVAIFFIVQRVIMAIILVNYRNLAIICIKIILRLKRLLLFWLVLILSIKGGLNKFLVKVFINRILRIRLLILAVRGREMNIGRKLVFNGFFDLSQAHILFNFFCFFPHFIYTFFFPSSSPIYWL